MVSRLVRLILLTAVLFVAACSTRSVILPELVMPADDPLASSPVQPLWEQALSARAAGDLAAASRLLERAVTLEPDSSWLHRELAELRLRQDQPAAAEGLARKALRLSSGEPVYNASLWQLVATARARQGDDVGAEAARNEADMFLRRSARK